MKYMLSSKCLLAICLSLIFSKVVVAEDHDGFKPIFDGKTLNGWKSNDMSYWSVENKAITAKITKQHPCTINQYLVWQDGELDDFELKLTFRMVSKSKVNGGFQFRSKLLPNHDVAGYQVDNNTGTNWLVRLYDEHGRHTLAFRGQRADIASDGTITYQLIPATNKKANFTLDKWHEYHLIARGPHLSLRVNDQLVAEVIDGDKKQLDLSGILALQLHSGPPMTVKFKDIRLKRLKPVHKSH